MNAILEELDRRIAFFEREVGHKPYFLPLCGSEYALFERACLGNLDRVSARITEATFSGVKIQLTKEGK